MKAESIAGLYYVDIHEKSAWEKKAKFKDRYGLSVNMMVEGRVALGLPRTWAPPPDAILDLRTSGHPIECKEPPGPRNAEQADILDDLGHAFNICKLENGLIVAPTGFGKTWIGCQLIYKFKVTTLVVTTKTDEMWNWCNHTKAMLGIDAVRWHGDKLPFADPKLTPVAVGLVQSIAKGVERYGFEIFNHFGMVIFDECHRLGADFFVKSCGANPARLRFGLSATPERMDGRTPVIEAHLGGLLAEATGIPMVPKIYTVPSDFKLPVKVVKGKVKPQEPTPGKSSWVDRAMRRNVDRNAQIIRLIEKCHKGGRRTVVFSNEKKHLNYLYLNCEIPQADMGFYIGGLKKETLEYVSIQPVIFATYQMAGQGTNYPWWDCCIFATPLANIKQALGRILREFPDKRQPIAWDVCDPGYVWGAYRSKREAVYAEYGAEVTTVCV